MNVCFLAHFQRAKSEDQISEGAARDVVTRWKLGKWVRVERIRAREPFWIWPSRLGLRKVGLAYTYRDLAQTSLDDLNHLYAINEICLHMGDEEEARWVSERQLLQGVRHDKGREALHRPDGEFHWNDGDIIGIEAELSLKKPFELAENLMELLRGENYLRLKADYGWRAAREMSQGDQSQYTEIWYFAPLKVRRQIRRERARLVQRGDLSEEEAERLFVRWYPLVQTDEDEAQEEREEREAVHLTQKDIDREPEGDGDVRPAIEGTE